MIKIDWSRWRRTIVDKSKETWNKFTSMGLDKEFKEDTEIQKILSPDYKRGKSTCQRNEKKSSLDQIKKNLLLGKYHVNEELKKLRKIEKGGVQSKKDRDIAKREKKEAKFRLDI